MLRGVPAVILAEAMPSKWSDFIRNSPMDAVRPLGTTPLPAKRFSYSSGGSTAVYLPPPPHQPGDGSSDDDDEDDD